MLGIYCCGARRKNRGVSINRSESRVPPVFACSAMGLSMCVRHIDTIYVDRMVGFCVPIGSTPAIAAA